VQTDNSTGSGSWDDTVNPNEAVYFYTPAFPGNNQVKVFASFSDDSYYYKPASLTPVTVPYTQKQLDVTPSFNATDTYRKGTIARIFWNTAAPAVNAADYKLYRVAAKYAQDITYNDSTPAITKVGIEGSWTEVLGVKSQISTTTAWVEDTGLDPALTYFYVLYAEVGGLKSKPAFYSAKGVLEIPANGSFAANAAYTGPANGVRNYSIAVGWNAEAGTTPTSLQRALYYPDPSDPTKLKKATFGDFVTLTIPPAVAGRYSYSDTAVDLRQSYLYRLTVTANGVTRVVDTTATAAPFSARIPKNSFTATPSTNFAYTIELKFEESGFYGKDLTVDIYRAEANDTATTNAWGNEEKTAFTLIQGDWPINVTGIIGGDYADKNLSIGTKYIYRVVYKKAGNTFIHDGFDEKSGYVQIPSVNKPSYIRSYQVDDDEYYFSVEPNGSAIPVGFKYELQYREAGEDDPWEVATTATVQEWTDDEWPNDVAVSSGDEYYFLLKEPTTANKAKNEYRLMPVNLEGTVAKTEGDKNDSARADYSSIIASW
jgi:hypothetical protein